MGCGVSHSRGQPSAAQDAPAAAWPTQAQLVKQVRLNVASAMLPSLPRASSCKGASHVLLQRVYA